MKKVIILIVVLLFLTGCDVEYNLKINKLEFSETMIAIEYDSNKWDSNLEMFGNYKGNTYRELIEEDYQKYTGVIINQQNPYTNDPIPGYIGYNKKKIANENALGIQYNYDFPINDYKKSTLAKFCYEYVTVHIDNSKIMLSTSSEFRCMKNFKTLKAVKINITSPYLVLGSNADSVKGRTYSWLINRDNYKDSNIYIEVNTRKEHPKTDEEKEREEKILKIFATIGIILLSLIIIVIFILMEKRRKLEND